MGKKWGELDWVLVARIEQLTFFLSVKEVNVLLSCTFGHHLIKKWCGKMT